AAMGHSRIAAAVVGRTHTIAARQVVRIGIIEPDHAGLLRGFLGHQRGRKHGRQHRGGAQQFYFVHRSLLVWTSGEQLRGAGAVPGGCSRRREFEASATNERGHGRKESRAFAYNCPSSAQRGTNDRLLWCTALVNDNARLTVVFARRGPLHVSICHDCRGRAALDELVLGRGSACAWQRESTTATA